MFYLLVKLGSKLGPNIEEARTLCLNTVQALARGGGRGVLNKCLYEEAPPRSVDRWIDESLYRLITGSMDRSIARSMDQWISGSVDQWIAESLDRWICGSVDSWIDGSIDR